MRIGSQNLNVSAEWAFFEAKAHSASISINVITLITKNIIIFQVLKCSALLSNSPGQPIFVL